MHENCGAETETGTSRAGSAESGLENRAGADAAAESAGEAQKRRGGAAPEERQCTRLTGSGRRCRDWAVRGHDLCQRHSQYGSARVNEPMDVPLLEDEDSIVHVLSQAARAMAFGTVPPANAHAILACCREARAVLALRLQKAKFAAQQKAAAQSAGASESADLAERADATAAEQASEADTIAAMADAGDAAIAAAESEALKGEGAELCGAADEDCGPEPAPRCSPMPRFRDLKTQWDRALIRTERQVGDMYAKRWNETRADREAALVRPYEAYFAGRG
jgi:hypothetical protein